MHSHVKKKVRLHKIKVHGTINRMGRARKYPGMSRAEVCRMAAQARWDALSPAERTEALRPAYSVTPGRPRKKHATKPSVLKSAKLSDRIRAMRVTP